MGDDHELNTYTPGTVLDTLHIPAPLVPDNYDREMIPHILLIQAQGGDLSCVTGLPEHKARTQTSNLEMFWFENLWRPSEGCK